MGKVYSSMLRVLRNVNVENRAHRVISREKPTPAPQYSYANRQRQVVDELYPDAKQNLLKKNEQLDINLKDVYVVSTDPKNKSEVALSTKPLPQERGKPEQFEYGFQESDIIPSGRCSLKEALTFLSLHSENPVEYTAEKIALQYKLNEEAVANILQHFKVPKVKDAILRNIKTEVAPYE